MAEQKISYIGKNENGVPTLYVKGEPFLILGGELHNSASSSLDFMEKEVWPYLRPIAMNTVILPIAWENIEVEEGKFDFSLLKGLIDQARREGKHLVLLWFGLWKNGESFYVPSWVKENGKKYFRACYPGRILSNTVSVFCEEAVNRDQNAFCRLMEFIREYDEEEQTIVCIQVENEVGFLGAERDFSLAAEEKYREEVPMVVRNLMEQNKEKAEGKSAEKNSERRQGKVTLAGESGGNTSALTWQEVFGEDAPETFMAYYYACALEKIAAAGKAIYPLPMYANAWLKQHPEIPGVFPSGGPVYDKIALWKRVAPSLDFLAPDIYVSYLRTVCEQYRVGGNPLMIPEARRDPGTAANVFYALGGACALGFSPFAVEDFLREEFAQPDQQLLDELNIDMSGFCCGGTGAYLQRSYELLQGMLPLILERRGTERMTGFIRDNANERGTILSMGEYDLELDYIKGKAGSAGLLLVEEEGFYIAGCNVSFKLLPKRGSGTLVTLVRMEEGKFLNGTWKGRILNGDEVHNTRLGDMAEIKYVRVCVQ